jgi:hypothetical protein
MSREFGAISRERGLYCASSGLYLASLDYVSRVGAIFREFGLCLASLDYVSRVWGHISISYRERRFSFLENTAFQFPARLLW